MSNLWDCVHVETSDGYKIFTSIASMEVELGKLPALQANNHSDKEHKFINCNWGYSKGDNLGTSHSDLITSPQGEVRRMDVRSEFRKLALIATCRSWQDYDNRMLEEQNEGLKKRVLANDYEIAKLTGRLKQSDRELTEVLKIIDEVYDLNKAGGPGSRKKVRELLEGYVGQCPDCGKAVCNCGD